MRARSLVVLISVVGAVGCGRSVGTLDQRAIDAALDAGLPRHLVAQVFDASVSLSEQTLTVMDRCADFDGGTIPCEPAAVAVSLGTRSSCNEPQAEYYSVIATFSRWSPGVYRLSEDPLSISFVHQRGDQGYYWPDQIFASEGAVQIVDCNVDRGTCAGWIDAQSMLGDDVRGPFTTNEACPHMHTP